ncbi:hypothetical protein BHF71_07610 [Vulcanibacillus modesticaldus]|uniref:Protein CotJB domain-containing protein n=1 Tax=Vulcanibacillus modesticaldus TaxID=337097 RepID=A0A1D2YVJ3_9BACI|nr:spore coat protein CotJB [Vulcanibacillus modesticaldus]OEF99748.1 hypothetical protein BHF71_07610 [Vulcanibacillus modesticaldus]
MKRATPLLYKLQDLEFAALELKLYLDTHPNDKKAQQDFTNLTYQIMQLMPEVERYYGPLTQYGFSKENPARWIKDPWPWEIIY